MLSTEGYRRYFNIIDITPAIQAQIDLIDEHSDPDQFNIPRLFSEFEDSTTCTEVKDLLDEEGHDFRQLTLDAEKEQDRVFPDYYFIQKPETEEQRVLELLTGSDEDTPDTSNPISVNGDSVTSNSVQAEIPTESQSVRGESSEELGVVTPSHNTDMDINNEAAAQAVETDQQACDNAPQHTGTSSSVGSSSASRLTVGEAIRLLQDQWDGQIRSNQEDLSTVRKQHFKQLLRDQWDDEARIQDYSRYGRKRTPNKKYSTYKVQYKPKQAEKLFGAEPTANSVWDELGQMEPKAVWKYVTPAELRKLRDVLKDKLNILPSSLFLTDKYDAFGDFEKLKARLVVCGNFQADCEEKGVDTESPTISLHTVFTLLAICAKRKFKRRIYDVSGAFLNAVLEHPEYMRLSKDVASIIVQKKPEYKKYLMDNGTMVVELKKALYGLRQASRAWYDLLCKTLVADGFVRSKIDACLFTKKSATGQPIYALVYVDDILVMGGTDNDCKSVYQLLASKFEKITEKVGEKLSYLGLEICEDQNGNISVSQSGYVTSMLEYYHITETEKYPGKDDFLKQKEGDTPCDKEEYLTLVMKLMYAAIRTRPDIIYYCSVQASRSTNPMQSDYDKLIHILKYLCGTRSNGLIFKSNGEIELSCYIDASFNCHPDARGHSGYVVFADNVGSAGIMYKSVKQKRVADSSAEAELLALHESIQNLVYISELFEELGYKQPGIPVYQDNQATIQMSSKEPVNFKGKSKLINRKYFGVHQYVEDGTIKLVYIGTEHNVSDFLTKALTGNKFLRFRIDIMGNAKDIERGYNHDDILRSNAAASGAAALS